GRAVGPEDVGVAFDVAPLHPGGGEEFAVGGDGGGGSVLGALGQPAVERVELDGGSEGLPAVGGPGEEDLAAGVLGGGGIAGGFAPGDGRVADGVEAGVEERPLAALEVDPGDVEVAGPGRGAVDGVGGGSRGVVDEERLG